MSRYGVALRRVGRALVGRCPLHDDGGRPNLHVYPDSQSWYCYRCDVGGDVIGFVMRIEHLDFCAAVTHLDEMANRLGVPRPLTVARPRPTQRRSRPWGPAERACLAAAVELYHNRLLTEPAALGYLAGRGVMHETAERCRLGYAAGDELAAYLRWRRLPLPAAIRVGLLGRGGREFLAGRIVAPEIHAGQPIWLVGRSFGDPPLLPKYLGLPGPRPLLGWEAAARSSSVVLVEGVFDWLTLVGWGIPALALLGTSVNPAALRALRNRFARLVLALDADAAGQAATTTLASALGPRAVPLRLPAGVKDVAELATHPDGQTLFTRALSGVETEPALLHRAA